jgi:hypothetical protein
MICDPLSFDCDTLLLDDTRKQFPSTSLEQQENAYARGLFGLP